MTAAMSVMQNTCKWVSKAPTAFLQQVTTYESYDHDEAHCAVEQNCGHHHTWDSFAGVFDLFCKMCRRIGTSKGASRCDRSCLMSEKRSRCTAFAGYSRLQVSKGSILSEAIKQQRILLRRSLTNEAGGAYRIPTTEVGEASEHFASRRFRRHGPERDDDREEAEDVNEEHDAL